MKRLTKLSQDLPIVHLANTYERITNKLNCDFKFSTNIQ